MCFPQSKGNPVYVPLYHIAAKLVLINMGGDKLSYVNPTELTAELLNTLIEKIVVHEAVKGEDGSREQEVEIFYRFIGKIE